MFRPTFRLTFHQRLLLITVIPVLGFVGVGSIFLYRIYEEYSAVSSDLRTWDAVESNLGLLGTLFAELKAERDLALLTLVKDRAGSAIANWKTQQNATDRALAALTIEMDRLERENVRVFGDNVKAVRAPFARLASVRAEIAAARLDGPQILSGYSRFTFNSFLLSESFRQQMRHPATYNFYDGIYIARKMREQDALVASVFIAVNAGYPFGKDGIATVRKQYYALTEGENYMRRPYPHLRAVFDPILKTDDASVAYYDFLATIAAASEFKALPRFPGGRSLLEVQAQRLDSYQKLVDNGFAFARSELNALATEHKRHAEFLSLSIAATLLLTLGVTFTVVRRTRGRLAGISESIDESASDVRTATAQLSDTSEQLSTNASSYAAALEEIDTSLKGIAGVAQQNAQHVAKADDIASHAKKSVSNGVSAVNDLSTAMDSISRSGREITKIISKINDISFQTNILALNAAVEAARAGEAGAGFSVVADEVRRLAQMCASAASETTVLIEESAHNASLALNKSGQVTRVFKDISQNVGDVGEIVANLNQGFHRQSRDIDRVNGAVANQRHVAQSTAAMARQTATAAGAMEDEVGNLGQSVHSLNSLLGHETPGAKPAASAPTVRPEVFAHSAN